MLSRAVRTDYRVTYSVLITGSMAFALMQSLITPVLPVIQEDLDTDQNTVTWLITAYLLTASVFTPIIGRIGDKVGKHHMLVFALGALAVGSFVGALATSIEVMILGRAVQGVGGGVLPLAFGIIRDEFPHRKVAGGVSTVSATTAVGAGVGFTMAGPIVSALNYHWLFWLPGIVMTATAIVAWKVVPPSPTRKEGPISVLPAVLLSAWLVTLLLAVSQGGRWGWGSAEVLGLFAATVVLLVWWIQVENRAAAPLIDMKMMRLPAVWTTNAMTLMIGAGMYASFAFVPQLAQTPESTGYGFGASLTEAGLILIPASIGSFICGMSASSVVRRIGAKIVVVVCSLIGAAAMLMLAVAHDEKWQLYVATLLMGTGIGTAFACLAALIVAAVPADQTGVAGGMNANIRTIGGAIGAAVVGAVVTSSVAPDGLPLESGYRNGFLVLCGVMVLSALFGMLIPKVSRHRIDEHAAHEVEHVELGVVAVGTVASDTSLVSDTRE